MIKKKMSAVLVNLVWILIFLADPLFVYGNDSTAMIAAGGIQLISTPDIEMVSEDLYVSDKLIRVHYIFKNKTDHDIKTVVAFPLPDLDLGYYSYVPLAGMEGAPSDNYLNFKATVNGSPISIKKNIKAFIGQKDISLNPAIRALNWQAPNDHLFHQLQSLLPQQQAALEKIGAIEKQSTEYAPDWLPKWTVKATFYWDQTFPAHQMVTVEHTYNPVVGWSYYSPSDEKLKKDYCVDRPTQTALDRLIQAKPSDYLQTKEIGYVLKTGANWSGSIGDFTITLDKGLPENILSTCLMGLVKKSPTTFQAHFFQYFPKKDLELVIITKRR